MSPNKRKSASENAVPEVSETPSAGAAARPDASAQPSEAESKDAADLQGIQLNITHMRATIDPPPNWRCAMSRESMPCKGTFLPGWPTR